MALFFAKTIKITDFIANNKVITNHQVLEDFPNAALEGEMQSHLEATKPESGNRRNGKMRKQLQTEYGPVEIGTPPSYILDIVVRRENMIWSVPANLSICCRDHL